MVSTKILCEMNIFPGKHYQMLILASQNAFGEEWGSSGLCSKELDKIALSLTNSFTSSPVNCSLATLNSQPWRTSFPPYLNMYASWSPTEHAQEWSCLPMWWVILILLCLPPIKKKTFSICLQRMLLWKLSPEFSSLGLFLPSFPVSWMYFLTLKLLYNFSERCTEVPVSRG